MKKQTTRSKAGKPSQRGSTEQAIRRKKFADTVARERAENDLREALRNASKAGISRSQQIVIYMEQYADSPEVKAGVTAINARMCPAVTPEIYTDEQQQAAKTLLESSDLLDQYRKIVHERVVEYNAFIDKLVIMLAGRLVTNPNNKISYNLCVEGSSGHGKSYVFDCVAKTLPHDQRTLCTRISPTAPLYMHGNEVGWTWNGKVLLLDDVPNDVLNSDCMKQFLSASDGAVSHVTHKGRDVEIRTKGKPTVLTNLVKAYLDYELRRRLPRYQVSMCEGHRRRLHTVIGQRAAGKYLRKDHFAVLRCANSLLQQVKVVVPYGAVIPSFFGTTETDTNCLSAFLDYIKASAALHQLQRESDGNGFIKANRQDYEIAIATLQGIRFGKDTADDLKGADRAAFELLARQTVPLTKNDLAALYGCTRENITPILNRLKAGGLIEHRGEARTRGRGAELWGIADGAWQSPAFPAWPKLRRLQLLREKAKKS